MPAAIRAVVFDLFDTLVDLRIETLPRLEHRGKRLSPTATALFETANRYCDVSFDDFLTIMGDVDRHFFESRYREHRELPTIERFGELATRLGVSDASLARGLTEVHMGLLRSKVEVPAHHTQVLASLADRVPLALCSNFSHTPTAKEVLEEGGMMPHLSAVVISEDVGMRKPHREIFQAVLDALDVAPEEILHVGDSLSADVGGAAPLGIRTAWITRRVLDPAESLGRYRGPAPDWQIADLGDLLELV